MLAIRLSRTGKKHGLHYKIVVLETRSKRDGKTTAVLGHWHPKQMQLVVDRNAYDSWVLKGARPSATVRKLISNEKGMSS